MPTPTYTALATVTLGSSASSVTFSSIPATYRDLIVVANSPTATGNNPLDMEFNGDTTNANYNIVVTYNQSTTLGSFTENSSYAGVNWYASYQPLSAIIQIMDYSATDKHKTSLIRANGASPWISMAATRWGNTAAITTVRLDLRGGSFDSGSTFALYGIEA